MVHVSDILTYKCVNFFTISTVSVYKEIENETHTVGREGWMDGGREREGGFLIIPISMFLH